MSRRVDQIQFVFDIVRRLVDHPHRMRLDCDSALLFQIHCVEQLIVREVALFNRPGCFEKPVGKRGLPMVDMGNNRKISDQFEFRHLQSPNSL